MNLLSMRVMGRKIYLSCASANSDDLPLVKPEDKELDKAMLPPCSISKLDDYTFETVFRIPDNWIRWFTNRQKQIMPVSICHNNKVVKRLDLDLGFFIKPIGVLDIFTDKTLSGWAWDPNNPDLSLDVDIILSNADTEKSFTVKAARYRKDLTDHGIGNGCHGFYLEFNEPLPNHLLAKAIGGNGIELLGSPKHLSNAGSLKIELVKSDSMDIPVHKCIFRNSGRVGIR